MSASVTPKQAWETMRSLPHLQRIRRGDLEPGRWLNAEPGDGSGGWGSWGVKAKPSKRGLTLMNLIEAGDPPPPEDGFATQQIRGAAMDPRWPLYPMAYAANKRYQVWADNVMALYEEAVSRQWSATRDIPWERLTPLPRDLERALCMICTHFTRVEFLAADHLGEWLAKIGYAYHEVKMFLGAQIMDETRHLEVFRKRAFANGGGMGASMQPKMDTAAALGLMPDQPAIRADYNKNSYAVQFIDEGIVLDLFRFSEFLCQTEVDKIMFQRIMQDEARHVSYGAMRLKFHLENCPDREEETERLHALADTLEVSHAVSILLNPDTMEPSAVLAGGGAGKMDRGYEAYRQLYVRVREEYLRRCDTVGFSRRDRCLLPPEPPF
ncbi:MAG: ferritin-like domain-containing protein [Chloroflexi bacterium]|nr:ferritin-like domain-containing protein [Chloroflexota bacterium]